MRKTALLWFLAAACAHSEPPPVAPPATPGPENAAPARTHAPTELLAQPAPQFRLPALNAAASGLAAVNLKPAGLAELAGPDGVLLVFGDWPCLPCRRDLAELAAKPPERVRVVAVLTDENDESLQQMRAYLVDQVKVPFPVVYDPLKIVPKRYRLRITPTHVLIDREGLVRWVGEGLTEGWRESLNAAVARP